MASRPPLTSLLALSLAFLLAGCATAGADAAAPTVLAATSAETSTDVEKDTHFDADDLLWEASAESTIALADGASASSADGVAIEGDSITISQAGDYRISGALSNGNITVDAPDAVVRLILDGAQLSNSTGSPLMVNAANEVLLFTAAGTENSIEDAADYADTDDDAANAAIYSLADLTIAGAGTLNVTGNHNDAINVKDGLVISSGTLNVEAADDGIRGKDYLAVVGGTINVTAGDDGIKADNDQDEGRGWLLVQDGSVTISAADDGVKAYNKLAVTGGEVTVVTSEEGMEAAHLDISGGVVDVTATDDGLNATGGQAGSAKDAEAAAEGEEGANPDSGTGPGANGERPARPANAPDNAQGEAQNDARGEAPGVGAQDGTSADTEGMGPPAGAQGQGRGQGTGGGGWPGPDVVGVYTLVISGGEVTITADGDGIDSNGTATISGGTTVINGPTTEREAPTDANGAFLVNGGTLAAAGSSFMAVTPEDESTQSGIQALFEEPLAAGTVVQVVDAQGGVVASFTTARSTDSLIYSASAITKGDSYTIYTGGTSSTDAGLGAGTIDGAAKLMEVTAGDYTPGIHGGR